jgi:hypothetical protein
LPLMQMSWPEQSSRVVHGPLHDDWAFVMMKGMFMMLKRKTQARKTRFEMWTILIRVERVVAMLFLHIGLLHILPFIYSLKGYFVLEFKFNWVWEI